ncbi:hypothetical protein [Nocardioides panacisoli]|uniref:Uncharacterized protein n=1 Tax=Nocardioides panacisoli TaxID=627624 RepID=A0ABP7J7L9_9ACTN
MLQSHAIALAQARSYVAALSDHANSHEASSAYEQVLITLDAVHGDQSPGLDDERPGPAGDGVLPAAAAAIKALEEHGVDVLWVELILAILEDARALDAR